jgi:hypothetical protein
MSRAFRCYSIFNLPLIPGARPCPPFLGQIRTFCRVDISYVVIPASSIDDTELCAVKRVISLSNATATVTDPGECTTIMIREQQDVYVCIFPCTF